MMHLNGRIRRTGFSLIELLITISILSLLLALLLPAVQKVRSAADRLSCQSNLRQIGIATLNYESTLGVLPPAFRHRASGTAEPNLQWPLLIAAYLELEPNRRMAEEDFRKQRDAFLPTPHRGVSIPLKPFSCPSDPRTTAVWEIQILYTLSLPQPTPIDDLRVALRSYVGNAGERTRRRDGVIVADGNLTMLSITDGTSNTLAFGERPPPANYLSLGMLYIGWGATAASDGELASVIGVRDPNPYARLGPNPACGLGPFPYRQPDLNATPDCSLFQYWSLHQGGANFAFADGSVRFLAYSADPILGALASRAGGEVPETIE